MWVGEEQCERIIEQVWSERGGNRGMEELLNLIQGCGQQLKIWNRHSFGLVKKKLNEARAELEKAQFSHSHSHDLNPEGLSQARNKVQLWLEREEVMWRQRSRIQWLKEGDQNTRFFHSSASMQRKRNTIQGLKDDQGHLTEGAQRDKLIVDFFEDLFTSTTSGDQEEVLSFVDSRVTPEMNAELSKPFVANEVKIALDQMQPTKAPGPDGMSALFF
ncbi:uncharacterized protein LOC122312779 [Carya illinoinensis]|uniref:uncharacterized protein LOC122312779 n=1 Tax=Carya illinoinensis TaxID=32201 RepID=UPI001C7190BA|nr:uncharacterized protein LOC122312779 [Carya illinoinensis]